MMAAYYVNQKADDNGNHEVHREGCYWLTLVQSKTYLGSFSSCAPAVAKATQTYPTADGCAHCSPACNTG